VFELAEDGRETESGQPPAQLVIREIAAEADQATQALVRARVDVQQGLSVVHDPRLCAVGRGIDLNQRDYLSPE
jgi:hypothetical protein